jgi:hypothetical protein
MPPDDNCPDLLGWCDGLVILMYAAIYHMQMEPPRAPYMSSLVRPRRSIRKKSQTNVRVVFTTPKMPVVRKEVLVPVMPMLPVEVGLVNRG